MLPFLILQCNLIKNDLDKIEMNEIKIVVLVLRYSQLALASPLSPPLPPPNARPMYLAFHIPPSPPSLRMQVQGVFVDWPVDRQPAAWLASRLLGWLAGLLAVLPESQPGEAVIFQEVIE